MNTSPDGILSLVIGFVLGLIARLGILYVQGRRKE